MIKYETKKKFGDITSVRDYIVKQAVKENDGLQIVFEDKQMTMNPEELKSQVFQCHKTKFKSKFNDGEYELYDFVFKPDNNETIQTPTEDN